MTPRRLLLVLSLVFLARPAVAQIPTWVAVGTAGTGTGDVTPGLPAGHRAGDLLAITAESDNVGACTAPTGYTESADSPQGTGVTSAGTKLQIFWKRDNGAEAAPTITDCGDHTYAFIHLFRDVVATGDPFNVTAGDVLASASATVTIPGDTTTVANTLVVAVVATALGTGSSQAVSGEANADLGSLTERSDNATSSGHDGSLTLYTGTKAVAGAYGVTTSTLAASAVQGRISFALRSNGLAVGTTVNETPGTGTNSTASPSITTPVTDPVLVVTIGIWDSVGGATITGLTLTGFTGTSARAVTAGFTGGQDMTLEIWCVTAPTANTAGTVQANFSGSVNYMLSVTSYTGANQTTPCPTTAGDIATDITATATHSMDPTNATTGDLTHSGAMQRAGGQALSAFTPSSLYLDNAGIGADDGLASGYSADGTAVVATATGAAAYVSAAARVVAAGGGAAAAVPLSSLLGVGR